MWSLPPPTPEAALQTHNVTRVEQTDALPDALQELIKAFPNAIIHTLPKESILFPTIPAEYTEMLVSGKLHITDHYLLPALHKARLIKTSEELHEIRKANEISSRAHETVMRVLGLAIRGAIVKGAGAGETRPLLPSEWLIEKESEAEAIFTASCRREGSIHQAYMPIVAASTRASTLHYCCNDREFSWGPVKPHDHKNVNAFGYDGDRQLNPQVLLIDAGCEWNCYASDSQSLAPVP
jgi:Xaa-Pro dipeptidase